MTELTVALVQTELLWEQPQANRRQLERQLAGVAGQAELMVLPEMFNRGFSMSASGAETMAGPTVQWLRHLAGELGAAICGSLAIAEGDALFNRFVMACPDGELHHYDKRHLFRMGGEHERYRGGRRQQLIAWRGWRICPLVCYDLRFPVWSRNRGDRDLLVYVANWPAARRMHWRQLLIARAIENQCAVVGVNRVGVDGGGIHYSGDSLAVDARGAVLVDAGSAPGIHLARLSLRDLRQYRDEFPVALDADDFTISADG